MLCPLLTQIVARVDYQDAPASNTRFSICLCFTDDNWIPEEGQQKSKVKIQKIAAKMFKVEEFQLDNGKAKSLL